MSLRLLPFCATLAIGLGLFPTAQAQGARTADAALAGYYAVYQNPFVIGLRKELDGYISLKQGRSERWHGRGRNDKAALERADLEQVDIQYLSSRFTVYKIEGEPVIGGRQVSILFIDKPDRIFKAWMYLTGDGVYELRGFKDSGITPEQIAVMRTSYEKLMLDREHAL